MTLNNRNRGQRRQPLVPGNNVLQPPNLPRKKRSYSEGVSHSSQAHHRNSTDAFQYIPMRETRSIELPGLQSVEQDSSGESLDPLNLTQDSVESSVFEDLSTQHHPCSPTSLHPTPSSPSFVDHSPNSPNPRHLHNRNHKLSMSVRDVKINANELGINDKSDKFWTQKDNNYGLIECQSEADLQREASAPIPGRYETSDCVSYEDLMEFALDTQNKTVCDEIRIMMKMFPNQIAEEDCKNALDETNWDLHSAVKLLKLKQLLCANLADKEQCKEALMSCSWDVEEAASYLSTPHNISLPGM